MSYNFYKILHFVGITLVLISMGGALTLALGEDCYRNHPARKWLGISHGVGLLVIPIAGFGLAARLGVLEDGIPLWLYGKIGVWILIGALLSAVGRIKGTATAIWFLIPALVGLAAWLALTKPL